MKDVRMIYGYVNGDLTQPLYVPRPGMLSNCAIVSCKECGRVICGSGGLQQDAVCCRCTDNKVLAEARKSAQE